MFWLVIIGSVALVCVLSWFGAKFSQATRRDRRDY